MQLLDKPLSWERGTVYFIQINSLADVLNQILLLVPAPHEERTRSERQQQVNKKKIVLFPFVN